MKYVLFAICFLLCCSVGLFSCEKEKDKESPKEDPNLFMKATINGTAWEANHFAGIAGAPGEFRGTIGDTGNSRIILCIPDTLAGTYNFRINEAMSDSIYNFNVTRSESDYLIQWSTTDEVNTKMFVIQVSSSSGVDEPAIWTTRDSLASKGIGSHDYQYLYKPTGWYFNYTAFRLKRVSVNNNFEYSKTRLVNLFTSTYYAAPGQRERMGFNSNITITKKEGLYLTGTFAFSVRLLNGDLIKVENGRFCCRYK
jgi:hypothetical protein